VTSTHPPSLNVHQINYRGQKNFDRVRVNFCGDLYLAQSSLTITTSCILSPRIIFFELIINLENFMAQYIYFKSSAKSLWRNTCIFDLAPILGFSEPFNLAF